MGTAFIIRWLPIHPLTRAYKAFSGACLSSSAAKTVLTRLLELFLNQNKILSLSFSHIRVC
jgi:hypothetical protein